MPASSTSTTTMFGDRAWDESRAHHQTAQLQLWLRSIAARPGALVVVECGAGTAIPTVRWFAESLQVRRDARLVRINPRDTDAPAGALVLACGALQGLRAIDAEWHRLRGS